MSKLGRSPAFRGLHAVGSGQGVIVRQIQPPSILSVLSHNGRASLVCERARDVFGIAISDGPSKGGAGDCTALGIGPGRWLFLGGEEDRVRISFEEIASISDHTDGYVIFGISGERAIDTIAKGVSIDLHPAYFTDQTVAVTVIAHIGAIVWKNTSNEFAIAVFRSYAKSFWHWLALSGAEFGLEAIE